jgi:hypothetical protein
LENLLNRRQAVPIDPKLTAEGSIAEPSTAEPSTANPSNPAPPRQKKTTKRQAAQPESSNKKSRTAGDPLEALEAHETDFKNTMSGFQEILSKRANTRLETQRLRVEEAKYLVELEKGKGMNDIAAKKARFEAAIARYPLLVSQWEQSGKEGPKPEVPKVPEFDSM